MTRRSSSARQRGGADRVAIILWRDIPAQVAVTIHGVTAKRLLAARFQKAIDKAARVAGLSERHRYLEQWRRHELAPPLAADAATVADDLVEQIDRVFDRQRLAAYVAAGGLTPAAQDAPVAAGLDVLEVSLDANPDATSSAGGPP